MSRRPQTPQNPRLFAKNKVMDLLAAREHSEKELRTKLRESFRRSFRARKKLRENEGEEFVESLEAQQAEIEIAIDEAIEFAKTNKWMGAPEQVSRKMADVLHRRNKGIKYINGYLQEKGLPAIESDRDFELEKALALVKNKFSGIAELPYEEKRKEQARVARYLASRGFDADIVRKVIYEKLRD